MGNPGALFLIVVGLLLVVVGFRGQTDNIIAAATGKPYKGSTLR